MSALRYGATIKEEKRNMEDKKTEKERVSKVIDTGGNRVVTIMSDSERQEEQERESDKDQKKEEGKKRHILVEQTNTQGERQGKSK